jgi:hypothetical protein
MVLKMMMFGAPGHAGHQMLHHVTSFYGAMQSMPFGATIASRHAYTVMQNH